MDETRSHLAELFAGRFTVIERLPWNGLALVYRSSSPGVTVALAVLPLDCENDSHNKEIFEQTMRRVSAVAHPIFAKIHEVGVQMGVPFVAYEHDQRPTLVQLLEREPTSPEFALRVARRLLGGLGAAHAAGIFHGDLTPTNVLCSSGDDEVRVVGLGIAPLLRHATPDVTGPTGRGSGKGAVRYLAPEILAGARGSVATDIFAVGALLHLMVTGSPPGVAGSVDTDVPGLADVVERAMHRDPDRRYASAAAMLEALELKPVKGREPSAAIPLWDSAPTRSRPPEPIEAKRSPWIWMIPVLAVAGAAAVYLGFRQSGRASEDTVAQAGEGDEPLTAGAGEGREGEREGESDDEASGEASDDEAGEALDDEASDHEAGEAIDDEAGVAIDEAVDADDALDVEAEREAGEANDTRGPLGGELPEFLAATMEQIADGYTFEEEDFRGIYGWIRNHQGDVRGHLVLCRAFMSRGWHTAAYERYEHVLGLNTREAKSDPRTLPDLIAIAGHGEDMVAVVVPTLRRFYGDELDVVAEAIGSTLAVTDERAAVRKLESLQRRIERLRQ